MIGKIYGIINIINGKLYIGKTYVSLDKRFKEHKSGSKIHKNRPLYRAFNKYGLSNFKIILIGEFEEGELEKREIYYIGLFNTYKDGYNATLGGDGKRYLNISKEVIQEIVSNTKTTTQACKNLGIDRKTLRLYLKEFNIEEKYYNSVEDASSVTREQALRIKYGKEKANKLIKELKISKFTISRIRNNKSWKNI